MRNAKYIVKSVNDTDAAKMQIRTITLENEGKDERCPLWQEDK